jgi:hypothetical protein
MFIDKLDRAQTSGSEEDQDVGARLRKRNTLLYFGWNKARLVHGPGCSNIKIQISF